MHGFAKAYFPDRKPRIVYSCFERHFLDIHVETPIEDSDKEWLYVLCFQAGQESFDVQLWSLRVNERVMLVLARM